jgi:hypothetical protein
VTWTRPTFTDNRNVSRLVPTATPGAPFAIGLHHVSYTAFDA